MIEYALCGSLVILGGVLLSRGPWRRCRSWGLAWTTLAAVTLWMWGRSAAREVERDNEHFRQRALPAEGRPGGYVSSGRCAACHPSQYATWHASYHRTMTQFARPETVRANFDGVALQGEGHSCRVERRGEEFWAQVEDPDWARDPRNDSSRQPAPQVWRRVGMLTGSHHMQVFWIPSQYDNLQSAFPFAYLFDDQRWVPLKDTFLKDPRLPQNPHVWNVNCLECHSTAGQPRPSRTTGFFATRVGELGIACEACHGPGADHVAANRDPLRRYGLHGSGQADPTIVNPKRLSAKLGSEVCGQCHGIKLLPDPAEFRENGLRYRPGKELNRTSPVLQPTRLAESPAMAEPLRRRPEFLAQRYWPDGVVRVSGRDYNGLIDSPCYQKGALSCLSCHAMHQSEPNNQLAPGMAGNAACWQCHTPMRAQLTAHTHHAADSSGSLCYNCHMPRTVYGLLKAIRSHAIESPSVAVTLRSGRPNGCNLCHLDRSLGWTDRYLAAWYGTPHTPLSPEQQTVSAALLWLLRGDAGQRALVAWHFGWEPAQRASGAGWLAPFLGQLLADPYAAVRYIAARSLRRLPGFEHFAYDFLAPVEARQQAREAVVTRWLGLGPTTPPTDQVLIGANGAWPQSRIAALLSQRDDHSMDLQE